ncbi:type IV secretion system DNA-binding domain-containing protein [Oryzomonas sagensis]|uniref:Type IV secretion system DNA-binding domain-containing protein n=1 Tax=Oryzomonas sagensis TaxID=2603857 RepID=A0ABQ6TL57_9BACT|nr:type IV secretion system DNA-binding domain-containing protein [Oryzomonas sagensis]KAB0669007.1 type IV secretion system DNA-binding domain-containing protein [Oryzomonas sagensis]
MKIQFPKINFPGTSYQGYEQKKHQAEMAIKMYLQIGMVCCPLQGFLFVILTQLLCINPTAPALVWRYPIALLSYLFRWDITFSVPVNGHIKHVGDIQILSTSLWKIYGNPCVLLSIAISLSAWILFPVALRYFAAATEKMKADEHIRGAKLITEEELKKKDDGSGILPLASFHIPYMYEIRHILITGQTGAGKSAPIQRMIVAVQEACRRQIIHDIKGEFTEKNYRPGKDLILNPLDARGLGWTILNEVKTMIDLSAITGSLIPASQGDDRFWSAASQDVARGVFAYNFTNNKRLNSDLWKSFTSPINDIADMCKATPLGQAGYAYIQDASSKQAASVIAVLMSYISWLEWATDGPFSLQDWAKNSTDQSVFVTTVEEVATTLKPYLSLFIDLAGKRLLSLPDSKDPARITYFVIDEIGNLQKLPTIKKFLTFGRGKNISTIIGVQESAGLESIYGDKDSRTMINNCSSALIMQMRDSVTTRYFSDMLGDEEYWQSNTTYSISQDDSRGGENHSRQKATRKIVMPSEITGLEIGEGYFSFPGGITAKIKIPWTAENNRPKRNEGFILRDGLDFGSVHSRAEEVETEAQMIIKSPTPEELRHQVEATELDRRKIEAQVEAEIENNLLDGFML